MKKYLSNLLGLLPYLFLAFVIIMLFWQVFFQGYVFIDGDNFHLNMPAKYLLVDAIHHKFFPFWNPYILGGIPYAADPNLGTFNPLNIFYLFFTVPKALTIQVIIDLFLVGSFQYILLRSYNLSKLVSLFGGTVFMLSGTVFIFVSNSAILHAIVYLPLLFLCARNFSATRKFRYFFLLLVMQVLQILAGHPQITYYTLLFITTFLLFNSRFSLRKRFTLILIYLISVFLLSGFQLIPFFEYAFQSTRQMHSLSSASAGSFTFSHLLVIFFPTFFGTKIYGDWWGSQILLFGYVGAATLLTALVGIFYTKFENKKFFIATFVISFLLALGKIGFLYTVFYYIVPGWSTFRSPVNILVLTTFLATIIAAFGLQRICSDLKLAVGVTKIIFIVSFALYVLTGLALFPTKNLISWIRFFQILTTYHVPYIEKILFYSPSKIQSIMTGITSNVFVLSIFLFLTTLTLIYVRYKKVTITIILLLSVANLLLVDATYLQLGPESFYKITVPSILTSLNNQYRIFSKPVIINHDKRYLPGSKFFYNEGRLNLLELTDNHVIPLHIMGITGYTSLIPNDYSHFISNTFQITGVDTRMITSEQLDELGVKYILSLSRNKNLQIQENTSALPRARLQEQSTRDSVVLSQSTPNMLNVSIYSHAASNLIVTDNYFPGWIAFVNGKEVSILKYKNAFREIKIPKGKSSVVFMYNPISWKIGVGFSLVGLCLLLLLVKYQRAYV